MAVNLCNKNCCTTCKYKGVYMCTCNKECKTGEQYTKIVNTVAEMNTFGSNVKNNVEENPTYINLRIKKENLYLLKSWIGSINRPESVQHLPENQRDKIAHTIQDFYEDICKYLED